MIKYLYRKSLLIQDKEKKLKMLLITHMLYTMSDFFNDFMIRIKLQYAKEFIADKSDRNGYDFLAIHYH